MNYSRRICRYQDFAIWGECDMIYLIRMFSELRYATATQVVHSVQSYQSFLRPNSNVLSIGRKTCRRYAIYLQRA